jgi:hypothetical protein
MSGMSSRLRTRLSREDGLRELDKVVQRYGVVNGKPFSFKDHEFQIEIIRDTRSRQSVRKCSQVGLSELMVQKTLALATVFPHKRCIFTLPTLEFANKFSKDRFDAAIENSEHYNAMVVKANNSASQKKIGSFTLYVAGSFGNNSAISVPAEILINDEVDFSNPEVLGKLSSRLRHAELEDERGYRGMRSKFSTPTVHDYGIDGDFENGHQAYYMVKCSCCQEWVLPNFFEDFVVPGFDGAMAELRKGDLSNPRYRFDEASLRCPSCRGDLWPALCDPSRRQWVAKRPDAWEHSYQVYPWDAPKYNPPGVVIRQLGDYPLISDYYNFVLGVPHSDAENSFNVEQAYKDRISDVEMWQYLVGTVMSGMRNAGVVAGMDIGKICHFVVKAKAGKNWHVVYAEKIKNTRENPATKEIIGRIDYFRCAKVCIDAGPDITLVNNLVEARHQVSAVVYVRSIKGLQPFEVKGEGEVINADRTKTLKELLAKHNSGEIRYMRRQDIRDEIFNHLKTTKKIRERSSDGDMVERFIKTSDDDHWVHALNYAQIAAMVVSSSLTTGVIGVLPGVSTVRVGSAAGD